METNRLKSGRGSSELLLFRFSFLFLPPLLTDAFVTRKKERKRERRRRPLFCLLFFHLVYSRFDLHHRDDDDYLHFLEKEKYFTPKKWLKSWRPVFCCCQFLLLSISQLLYLNIGEREKRKKTCRHRVIYSALKELGDFRWWWWWAVAWHLFDTWAPRASY